MGRGNGERRRGKDGREELEKDGLARLPYSKRKVF